MIKQVIIKNYKSLVDFKADFSSAKNVIVIYGENGSGKTNFLDSLNGVFKQVNSLENINFILNNFKELFDESIPHSLNTFLKNFQNETSLEGLFFKQITKGETFGSIHIDLEINNHLATYILKYNHKRLLHEELHYLINKNIMKMYHFEYNETNKTLDTQYLSPQLFTSNKLLKEINNQVEQYWGKHSFLSILTYFINSRNETFFKDEINTNLIDVIAYFNSFNNKELEKVGKQTDVVLKEFELPSLTFSTIKNTSKNIELLNKASTIIYEFLSPLYQDLVDVDYIKEVDNENNELSYELIISKDISNKIRKIPYNQESSGTKNLIQLLPYIISFINGNIVLIDEVENAIHDLLIKEILLSLEDETSDIKGQLIITTHNTLIMEQSSEQYIFILDEENGKKIIEPISNYSKVRYRENHNLRKRYLEGLYQGIPYSREIDFSEIMKVMEDE